MIPLIKQKLFVSLSKNAKAMDFSIPNSGVLIQEFNSAPSDVSLKNIRRIKRFREAQAKKDELKNLMAKVHEHKQENKKLKEAVSSLTNVVNSTINSHDSRRKAVFDLKKKLKSIESLKHDLSILRSLLIKSHESGQIDDSYFKSLNSQVSKLETSVEKKHYSVSLALEL